MKYWPKSLITQKNVQLLRISKAKAWEKNVGNYFFRNQGKDVNKVVAYMATFWNSVDLQYREVTEPNIRPNLMGIVIPQVSPSYGLHWKRNFIFFRKFSVYQLCIVFQSADVFDGYDSQNDIDNLGKILNLNVVQTFPVELQYDMVVSYTWR